jgi:ribosomal protein S18 acetylase RimI-like enzyme
MNTRIIPATPADLPLIERLARATWPATFGDIISAEQIEYMLHRMYRPEALEEQLAKGHVFHLILERAGTKAEDYAGSSVQYRPVGYVSHELDYRPAATKIHKLYVLPGTQGKGFGRALVQKVERIARRAGQRALRLDVNYQNPAVGFYERLGFEKVERFDTEIGNGYLMEDWRMVKLL